MFFSTTLRRELFALRSMSRLPVADLASSGGVFCAAGQLSRLSDNSCERADSSVRTEESRAELRRTITDPSALLRIGVSFVARARARAAEGRSGRATAGGVNGVRSIVILYKSFFNSSDSAAVLFKFFLALKLRQFVAVLLNVWVAETAAIGGCFSFVSSVCISGTSREPKILEVAAAAVVSWSVSSVTTSPSVETSTCS